MVRGEQVTYPGDAVRQLRTLPGCPDHVLFICMLALPAARRRPRALATLQSLALLTAIFTVGHSVSLALAALGCVTLPSCRGG